MKHYRPNFKPTEPPQPPPAAALAIPVRSAFPVCVRWEVVSSVGKHSGLPIYKQRGYDASGKWVQTTILTGEALTNYLYRPVEPIAAAA